jgi:hypothetical protein
MTKRFRPWDPKQKWLLPPEITAMAQSQPANLDFRLAEIDEQACLKHTLCRPEPEQPRQGLALQKK